MAKTYTFDNGERLKLIEKNRFSVALPFTDPFFWTLEKWRDWFVSRGINAALLAVPGKPRLWAVYRNGMENLTQVELNLMRS